MAAIEGGDRSVQLIPRINGSCLKYGGKKLNTAAAWEKQPRAESNKKSRYSDSAWPLLSGTALKMYDSFSHDARQITKWQRFWGHGDAGNQSHRLER